MGRLGIAALVVAVASFARGEPPRVNTASGRVLAGSVDVAHLVEQLGDREYGVRERATVELGRLGPEFAETIDEAHVQATSLEVRRRLDRVRSQMWGPGLVLRLPLAGHARDASGRRNHGRTTGDDWTWSGDLPCLDTSRDPGSVVVPDDRDLDTDTAFTLAAWIRPTRIEYVRAREHRNEPGEPTYPWGEGALHWAGHFIVAKWYSTHAHGDYIFAISPSGQLGLGVANRSPRFQCDSLRTTERIPLDRWTHVAATFDGGAMTLFLNGEKVASKNSRKVRYTTLEDYDQDDLFVGRLWADGYEFRGTIREVFVFRRAIDDRRVRSLFDVTQTSRGESSKTPITEKTPSAP